MPNKLCIVIIILMLIFIIYIMKTVAKKKMTIKNSLLWFILSIGVIFCAFQIDNLAKIAKIIGIETVSNMLFFLGFVFLIFVCFNLTKNISSEKQKVVKLTQEIALIKKELEDEKSK